MNRPRAVVAAIAATLVVGTGWSFALDNLERSGSIAVTASGDTLRERSPASSTTTRPDDDDDTTSSSIVGPTTTTVPDAADGEGEGATAGPARGSADSVPDAARARAAVPAQPAPGRGPCGGEGRGLERSCGAPATPGSRRSGTPARPESGAGVGTPPEAAPAAPSAGGPQAPIGPPPPATGPAPTVPPVPPAEPPPVEPPPAEPPPPDAVPDGTPPVDGEHESGATGGTTTTVAADDVDEPAE